MIAVNLSPDSPETVRLLGKRRGHRIAAAAYRARNLEACRQRTAADYHKNKEARNKTTARWREANRAKLKSRYDKYNAAYRVRPDVKQKARSAMLLRTKRVSLATYDAMLEAQGGVCAICGDGPPWTGTHKNTLAIDHDHATGVVRGLLCACCNLMIGNARDTTAILRNGIAYLGKFATGGA